MKTSVAPSHCRCTRAFPKKTTDARTVKNLRVVVTMEQGNGPNSLTHMKMKYCPRAEATEKRPICQSTDGWRETKPKKSHSSPVAVRATARKRTDHMFIERIMWPDLVWCSDFMRSWTAPVTPSQVRDTRRRISPMPKSGNISFSSFSRICHSPAQSLT